MEVMEFCNRKPTPEQYNALRARSGLSDLPHDPGRITHAMEGSGFVCSVWEEGELIGLGRVVDDGGICYSINDIMVDRRFQRRGIADRILSKIDEYLDERTDENSFVTLIAKRPADHIYHRHRFEYIPEDQRCGMIRNQQDLKTGWYSPV